jgi:ribosomal protein S27AE
MFECYNKEKIIQRAYEIKKIPKEDIKKMDFFCPKCNEPLNFIEEYTRLIYGKTPVTQSHFKHKLQTNCEGYYPLKQGESLEHYKTKMELKERLQDKTPIFKIGNLLFSLELNDFEIDWLESKEEERAIPNRQADVLLKLKEPNALFGNGIAIEIQKSESQESIDNKKIDYALKGFSLCQTRNGYELEIKQTYPEILLSLFELQKDQIKRFEEKIKIFERDFRIKAHTNNWECTNCDYAAVDNADPRILICWKHKQPNPKGGNDLPTKRSNFTPCDDYVQRAVWKPKIELSEEQPKIDCDRGVVE